MGIGNWKQAFLRLFIEGGWSWAGHFPTAPSPTGPGSTEGRPGGFQEGVALGQGCRACTPALPPAIRGGSGQTASPPAPLSAPSRLVLRIKEAGGLGCLITSASLPRPRLWVETQTSQRTVAVQKTTLLPSADLRAVRQKRGPWPRGDCPPPSQGAYLKFHPSQKEVED